MPASKIKSNATYHKCINELKDFGYIKYIPSYDPYKKTQISIILEHATGSANKE